MADVELKIDGLEKLLKAFKADKIPKARIGILGAGARSGGGPSNAEIGVFHEFGTRHMPVRSFLRFPLIAMMQKYIERSGLFDRLAMREVIDHASLLSWTKKLAIVAESVVLDGFDTGGFGMWPALAPSTLQEKKVSQILVESQQLRSSIISEVSDA